jgi:hypothetical protein
MIMITIPFPGDPDWDERHGGPAIWKEYLTSAPRVLEAAGIFVREFEGRRADACADHVRAGIGRILEHPGDFPQASYLDLQAITEHLTGLFFTLRSRPEGIVQVS